MPARPTDQRPGPGPRRLLRLAVAMAVLVLAATAVSGPAQAQAPGQDPGQATPVPSSSAQNPSGNNRWGFTPTGPDRTVPGPRNDFTYQLAPGASVDDSVTVWNYSDVPANFVLYATDALNTPEGAFDLLPRAQAPTEAGTWVKVSQGAVIVPPRSGMTVPFTVTVPADAAPGDHAGGLVASIEAPGTDPEGRQITVDTRFGLPAYVQVAGDLAPGLSVENLQSHYHRSPFSLGAGDLDVTWTVRNTGNVRLSAHQSGAVKAPFGWTMKTQSFDDVPELLPGSSVSYSAHFSGVLPTFRLTTTVTLEPFSRSGDLDPAPPKASASSSVWAVPWLLVILIVVVIGLVVWRRRRAARRGRSTIDAASGSGGMS
jgi:hypothetical protein